MNIVRNENNKVALYINDGSTAFLRDIINKEIDSCKNTLIHLKREVNDPTNNGETTWRSGGCTIKPEYAASIMYDTIEKLATLEDLANQLEVIEIGL